MESVFSIIINSNMIVAEWPIMNVHGKMVNVNILLVLLTRLHHLVI